MSEIMNCTPASPMPADRDQTGQRWYHHGAKAMPDQPDFNGQGSRQLWKCPNCSTQFWVTAGHKVSHAEAAQKVADMRARGWR